MKYTFTLTGHAAPGVREKLILESRAGESDRHIALKALAYVLFRGEAAPQPLRIEQGVGQRHKPDLVATDEETGAALLWIDCGQIETRRLGRIAAANPQAQVVVVKAGGNEARLYARAAARFLPEDAVRRAAIRFIGFGEEFIPAFVDALRGTNDLVVDVPVLADGATLAVTLNGAAFATPLMLFRGDSV